MQDRQRHRQGEVLLCSHREEVHLQRRPGLVCNHNCLATLPRITTNSRTLAMQHGSSELNKMRWRNISRCGPFKTTRSTQWLLWTTP